MFTGGLVGRRTGPGGSLGFGALAGAHSSFFLGEKTEWIKRGVEFLNCKGYSKG